VREFLSISNVSTLPTRNIMEALSRLLSPLLRWFVWIVEPFTWAKSFRQNPILGNYWLNRCGLHVTRVVIAQLLFRLRLCLLSPLVPAEQRRQFISEGYILIENYLPPEQFARLKTEAINYSGLIREFVEGTTLTQRSFMTEDIRNQLPELNAFTQAKPLDRLMRWCSSKNRAPFFFIENLCNHANVAPQSDPQRDLHADTFHPCVKGWLFLDPANDDNGPHVYVPRSHRLSWARLKWEYKESLIASLKGEKRPAGRYWDGSFRVTPEALHEIGLEPKAMHVPENTLLVANVYGFHCRGIAHQRSHRMTVWMQARDNPFNPFFTPFPKAASRIFEWVWKRELARQDRAKIKEGIQRNYEGKFDRSH